MKKPDALSAAHSFWHDGSRSGSGSGSGTASAGWRLTSVTESGGAAIERTLDYLYLGQGGNWYEASYNGEGSEASHEWETTQSVFQQSTSAQTVNKTTSYATGSPVTTGGETRGVTAWGVIDETHQSASANRSWGQSGGGWESASGSSYEESIHEQYDYYQRFPVSGENGQNAWKTRCQQC